MKVDKALLAILACPLCKHSLIYQREKQELLCLFDKIAFPIKEDIPVLIATEARELTEEELQGD